ncbi:hypothetical protein [Niallia circulans]|uniref:hypothetical protein n=1 Tax=Niallia circulans TaxID=1397 RepID=UPI00201D72C4|nr:hypothetical protein [Niallia circulans]
MLVVQGLSKHLEFPRGQTGIRKGMCKTRNTRRTRSLYSSTYRDFYFGHTKWKDYFYFAASVGRIPVMNEMDKIIGIRFVNSKEKINFPIELSSAIKTVLASNLVHDKITKWI